jgi:hypothetical protein
MKHILKIIGGSALGLACLVSTAQAALLLSGSTQAAFQGSSSGWTEINNAPDGSFASYRTGLPVTGSFKSGVVFDGSDFVDISDGDDFSFGLITYYNGRTLVGTSAAVAKLDVWLDLSDPAWSPLLLTTITFVIDPSLNAGGLIPDFFLAAYSQPDPIWIDGYKVQFTIEDLPLITLTVGEGMVETMGNLHVEITPIPEPATYGMIASASLLGLAAYRRFRGQKGRDMGNARLAAA